jgi:hypothetical protein
MINEITKDISVIYDRIISKLTNYINNPNNNQKLVLEVLKSIDNFIRTKLPKDNITLNNIIIRDKISSLKDPQIVYTDYNEDNNYIHEKNLYESIIKEPEPISSKQYFIIKLKRKIKEQHEKNKIRELGYLERICNLQKRLNILETNNLINQSKEIAENEDKKYDFLNKSKIRILLNSSDKKKPVSFSQEKNKDKKYNKIYCNNENQKLKQMSIKINENNKLNKSNKFLQTFSDLRKYQSLLREMEISNTEYNNEISKLPNIDDDPVEKNLFINKHQLMSLKNSKVKKKNMNIVIRHNYKEIKKTIENGKRKIRFLKDCRTPEIYKKYISLFESEN